MRVLHNLFMLTICVIIVENKRIINKVWQGKAEGMAGLLRIQSLCNRMAGFYKLLAMLLFPTSLEITQRLVVERICYNRAFEITAGAGHIVAHGFYNADVVSGAEIIGFQI